jgi:hypothetical protein
MMSIRRQKRIHGGAGWHRHADFIVRADSLRIQRFSILLVTASWFFLSVSPIAVSQNEESAEYTVKLAFLYNFTKFVEWPPDTYRDPSAPLVICVVGHDPFRQDLEGELRTRTVGGQQSEKPRDSQCSAESSI